MYIGAKEMTPKLILRQSFSDLKRSGTGTLRSVELEIMLHVRLLICTKFSKNAKSIFTGFGTDSKTCGAL